MLCCYFNVIIEFLLSGNCAYHSYYQLNVFSCKLKRGTAFHSCVIIFNVVSFYADRSTVTNNKYDIPPEKKWISLFSQCRKALGCSSDRDPDLKVVWQSISVALKSKRDSKLSHGDQEILQDLLNINSEMEQSAKVTAELPKVQLYLSKVRLQRKKYLVSARCNPPPPPPPPCIL